jgi:exopolysaccharide biosynthesis polyprenyl glycosylphosphotransferase
MSTSTSSAGTFESLRDAAVQKLPAEQVASGLREFRRLGLWMVLTDLISIMGAFATAYAIRFGEGSGQPIDVFVAAAAVPAWIAILGLHGLYRPGRFAPSEELRRVFYSVTLGTTLLIMASFWSQGSFSRSWLAMTWILALVFILATRRIWHAWMGRARAAGRLALRTLVIGANSEAMQIASALQEDAVGYSPIGFLADGPTEPELVGLPRLGQVDDLADLMDEHAVECLYVASSAVTADENRSLLRIARAAGVETRISTHLADVLARRITVQPVGDLMAVNVAPVRLSGFQVALKRAFDLVVAAVLGIGLAPVWITAAIAVKLDSRGPALFRQERVTKAGRVFRMYKFRTMSRDANDILRQNGIDPTVPYFKIKDDPRLTRVGRLIRRLSVDEIPQLINVIKGDMSLVGPRPLPADQVAANLELLEARHEVPAGVTGWTQTGGRSELSAEEQLRLDQVYIENWSLSLDIYLLWKTLGAVLAKRGAF